MIWVGTDDGNLQLTRDGGQDLDATSSRNVPGLPPGVVGELGRGEPLRRRHRLRRVRPPHLRRHDAVGLPHDRLRQDLDAHRRARAGRARLRARDQGGPGQAARSSSSAPSSGCGSRVDGGATLGASSRAATSRASRCATSQVQPRDHDLVLATHGRGIWIVDDLTPLRALTPRRRWRSDARSCRAGPCSSACRRSGGWAEGDAAFVGQNPRRRRGHHLLPAHAPPVRAAQARGPRRRGQAGRHARRRPSGAGINRVVVVDAGQAAARAARRAGRVQRDAGPARRARHLHAAADQGRRGRSRRSSTIGLDRRAPYTAADRKAQFDAAMRAHALFGEMSDAGRPHRRPCAPRSRARASGAAGERPARREAPRRSRASSTRRRRRSSPPRRAARSPARSASASTSTSLYGALIGWEGRPARYQLERIDVAAARARGCRPRTSTRIVAKDMRPLDGELQQHKLEPIPTASARVSEGDALQACEDSGNRRQTVSPPDEVARSGERD